MDIYDENEYHDEEEEEEEEEDNDNADSDGGDDDEIESKCGGVSAVTGSLAERRAAKLGFNAERISTALFRTDRAVDSPVARSPCLMIPPGISPTALLDSPIMLPNSQLSPTTGTFSLPVLDHESSIPNKLNPADNSGSKQNQGSSISRLIQTTGVDCQAFLKTEPPADFELPARNSKENTRNTYPVNSVYDVKFSNDFIADEPVVHEDVGTSLPPGMVRNSEDGYNWRKYGQKQVKGSEYPRSYYKCTHPNCQMKKKVERSYDGQITEIIYKGTHNHPKPQPSRRPLTISTDEMYEKSEGNETCVKVEDGPAWRNFPGGLRDFRYGSDLERTPSTSILTELSDQLSPTQGKSSGVFGSPETPEFSSTQATHGDNDEDDGVTQGSVSLADDANDDESQFKRRRMENSVLDTHLTSRAIREPKVVIQIESAEDILEDGYRWRKYGQKVVKGNPNPRSYYKCTSPGCPVRKHVERASNDLKCVITTYEGKHNHLVPAARNSSHVNTNSGASLLPPIDRSHSPLTLHRSNCQNPKSQLQIHDIKPEFISNDYISSNFLVSPPPLYQMKFPQIQSPYGSLGLNLNTNLTQSTSINSAIPDFPISFPWGLPSSSNLSLGSFGLNNNHGKPIVPIQSFVSGQQLKENDIRLVRPKQERKDENPYDACLPIVDHANGSSSATSSSSLLYHQLMGNFTS